MKNKVINRLRVYLICSVVVVAVFSAPFVSAKDYTFSWAENDGLVEGYRLYYKEGGIASVPFEGITANEGCSPIDIGNATSFTISGLDEKETYHFTLTAYSGNEESDFTEVITVSPEAGAVSPEVGAVSPEAGAVSPEVGAVYPGDGAVSSEAGAMSPKVGAVSPELGTVSPEVGAASPEDGAVYPEVEKLARFKLAFPIILEYLLDSDS